MPSSTICVFGGLSVCSVIEDAHGLLLHPLLQLAGRDDVEAHQSGEHGCSLISAALQSALGFARRSQTASPTVTRMALGSKRKARFAGLIAASSALRDRMVQLIRERESTTP